MSSWLKKLFSAGARPATAETTAPSPVELPGKTSTEHRRRGNRFLDQGNLPAALACYRQAVALDPSSPDAHTSLGFALQQTGELGAAQAALQQALTLQPNSFDASYLLGQVCTSLQQPAQAAAYWETALGLQPTFEPLYGELCQALFQAGALDKARSTIASGIQRFPQNAAFHFFLGNLHAQAQEWTEAIARYAEALRIDPSLAQAYGNLASAFQNQGRWTDALAHYDKALSLVPRQVTLHNGRATVLLKLGCPDAAIQSCLHALVIEPDSADTHLSLGYLYLQSKDYRQSEQHSRKVLAMRPGDANAQNNLGNALAAQGELREAERYFNAALSTTPASAVFHSNLGGTLVLQGRLEEAISSFRQAISTDDSTDASILDGFSNLLFALNYHPNISAEKIFESYREYEQRFATPYQEGWTPHPNDRRVGRRLKVGYVSPDFRNHACTFFLEPLLAQHNHNVVELYAYAELTKEDAVTQRYKQHIDHWVPTVGLSDAALAQRIRADGIDILVDLAGHTAGNRLGVFARKPAPVSLSWMGYGYTTGLQAIDYYLTDVSSVPIGSEHLFSEVPWRLPGCFAVYRPSTTMGEVNTLPALERGYVTLGTLTRAIRINHHTIRVWAQILQRLPTARIVIDSRSYQDPAVQEDTVAKFVALGIARERLHIGFNSPPWDVLRDMDIGLDCFPHNSGTTLFETLYMGLPYITLEGRPSVGRIGSAILHGLGRPEWIAQTEDDYVDKVVALASDLPALAQVRSTLRMQMQASVLMDESGFARAVEAAYAEMFVRWQAQTV